MFDATSEIGLSNGDSQWQTVVEGVEDVRAILGAVKRPQHLLFWRLKALLAGECKRVWCWNGITIGGMHGGGWCLRMGTVVCVHV